MEQIKKVLAKIGGSVGGLAFTLISLASNEL
jgi:hypothetical protein